MHRLPTAIAIAQASLLLAVVLLYPSLENLARSRHGLNAVFLAPLLAELVVLAASVLWVAICWRGRSKRSVAVAVLLVTLLSGWLVVESSWDLFHRYAAVRISAA